MSAVAEGGLPQVMAEGRQSVWDAAVAEILPEIHPVDRAATEIWFRFWPLKLNDALRSDKPDVVRELELDGTFRLSEQIDSSVAPFYASKHWPAVKSAALEWAAAGDATSDLASCFRAVAQGAAARCGADAAILLGIGAAAVMILKQAGAEAVAACADQPAKVAEDRRSPEKVLKDRQPRKQGLATFFKGVARTHSAVWNERDPQSLYTAIHGQNLSDAAAGDANDYRDRDGRCKDGPLPAQCRSGACGYCWIGVLAGEENLSKMTEFEQRRLWYFGYRPRDEKSGDHPRIRLACQAQCYGDVTFVMPPWNGVLDGQR